MCVVSGSNLRFSWTHSVWDPTEPIATRPLFTTGSGNRKFFYTFDGNKNVSELVHFETRNGIAAHYDYAPFGAVTRAISASAVSDNTFTTDNPFRFSSEYHDDTLGLVYYNYRHYNPVNARWCGRDLLIFDLNLYEFIRNNSLLQVDTLGLKLHGYMPNTSMPSSFTPVSETSSTRCLYLRELFNEWYEKNSDLSWTKDLLSCPLKLKCVNGRFESPNSEIWTLSPWWTRPFTMYYHPGGRYELRTSNKNGSGSQCVYNECGNLIIDIPGTGSADKSSPTSFFWELPFWKHQKEDVLPYDWALALDKCFPHEKPSYVNRYYQRRPPTN